MKIEVNYNKAAEVINRLNIAFKNKWGILSEIEDLVENQIPDQVESLSKEHALFLFYVVVNDHGMKSNRLYNSAKLLYNENPFLFNPDYVVKYYANEFDEQLIADTGIRLGTRYPKVTAKNWYLNSQKLLSEYSGDPIKLFNSTNDAKELIKIIKSFYGFGPKIGGMLLRAIIGLGFNKSVNSVEEVLVPVDIHDSRISFFTGMIDYIDPSEVDYYKYVKDVQILILNTCNQLDIEWLDVDRALWLIGSRGCANKRCLDCPINNFCSVGSQIVRQEEMFSIETVS
jgi:endonuclease III